MIKNIPHLCVGLLLASVSSQVFALENGADSAALGAEGFMAANLPPKGTYFITYYQNYSADKFVDNKGNSAIPGFSLDANALVARVVVMTDKKINGGRLGFYAIQPFVDMDLKAAGASDSNKGMGDFVAGSLLAWHNKSHNWGAGIEATFPTGEYDKHPNQPVVANLGKNYYTIRPVLGYSYDSPDGWDISTKFTYSYNTENKATAYQSGDYVALDYNVGHKITPALTAGVAGYALKQLSADKVNGESIGNKSQVIAYGPTLTYHPSPKWFIESKYLFEDQVENRPEGNTAWIKLVRSF